MLVNRFLYYWILCIFIKSLLHLFPKCWFHPFTHSCPLQRLSAPCAGSSPLGKSISFPLISSEPFQVAFWESFTILLKTQEFIFFSLVFQAKIIPSDSLGSRWANMWREALHAPVLSIGYAAYQTWHCLGPSKHSPLLSPCWDWRGRSPLTTRVTCSSHTR